MIGITEKIKTTINDLKCCGTVNGISGIDGCITGSTMLDEDFDAWKDVPDIDVFTYSAEGYVHAIDIIMMKLGFEPGDASKPDSVNGEAWKINKLMRSGMNWKLPLSTVKMNRDGVTVNVTLKKDCRKMIDVLSSFDMTIIMKGYDIQKKVELDLTGSGEEKHIARRNPYREMDGSLWDKGKWMRQVDRVYKYDERGFDTRPIAREYIKMYDDTVDAGALFLTEKGKEAYREWCDEHFDSISKLREWLKEKED